MPKSKKKSKSSKKKNLHQRVGSKGSLSHSQVDMATDSLTNRDTRLFENSTSSRGELIEQIERDKLKWAEQSVVDLLAELKKYGLRRDEQSFVDEAKTTLSALTLGKKWALTTQNPVVPLAAIATVLWDKLCPNEFHYDELDTMMSRGYAQFQDRNEDGAVEAWLPGWELVKRRAKQQGYTSVEKLGKEADDFLGELVWNWLQDIEMALGNLAGDTTPEGIAAAEQRLKYVRELMTVFPDSDAEYMFNMRRAEGESLFMLGLIDEGDKCYENLIRDYPTNAWSYIGWGDEYSPMFWKHRGIHDAARAKAIYEQGLKFATEDLDAIEERIELLGEKK